MSDQFNVGVKMGMVSMVVASTASALAVGGVLLYIAYSVVTIQQNASRRWSTDTHIHYYFLSLMVSDLIQAVGGLLNIRWIIEAGVYPGPFCTVQGFFKQVGDVGVALSTTVITLYTLQVFVLKWKAPPKFPLLILAIIWLDILILVVVPNVTQHDIYGPTGHWCWIDESTMERIGLDYIWMWLAAALNIISYLFLAFFIKRLALLDGNKSYWRRQEKKRTLHGAGTSAESVASQLFYYPLVYIIVVLPISAARFSQFRGHHVPFAVTAFADTLFASSGLFDTILYAVTRPILMPRRPSKGPQLALIARPTTVRMAHDRFSQDYMVKNGNSVTETGLSRFHDISDFPRAPRSARI